MSSQPGGASKRPGSLERLIGTDTETTGLSPSMDQIIEVAFSVTDLSGRIIETHDIRLAYRGDTLPSPEAVAVTKVNPLRSKGLTERQAAEHVYDLFMRNGGEGSAIAGQNVNFDKVRLRSLLARNGIDGRIIPHAEIDLMNLSAVAIASGKIDRNLLDKTISRDVTGREVTRPSRSLGSIAKAMGLSFNPGSLHGARQDLDLTMEAITKLGVPDHADGKGDMAIFNNPYQLQSQVGHVMRVDMYDPESGEARKKRFYVTGFGVETVSDAFGEQRHHKTVIIDLDAACDPSVTERLAAEAKAASEGRDLSRGGVTQTMLETMTVERGFGGSLPLSLQVDLPSREEALAAAALVDRVVERVRNKRKDERAKFIEQANANAKREFVGLAHPDNHDDIFAERDELTIDSMAVEFASLSDGERRRKIVEIANSPDRPRGSLWANNYLTMIEKYGFRNGLPGYEKARERYLRETYAAPLPSTAAHVASDNSKAGKLLREAGIESLLMTSDPAVGFRIEAARRDGSKIQKVRDYFNSDGGKVDLSMGEVDSLLADALGINPKNAIELRRGMTFTPDSTSYDAIIRRYRFLANKAEKDGDIHTADLLRQVVRDAGPSIDLFIKNSEELATKARQHSGHDAPVAAREKPTSAGNSLGSTERAAETRILSLAERIKTKRQQEKEETPSVQGGQQGGESAEPDSDEVWQAVREREKRGVEFDSTPIKCKVCNRKLAKGASVQGMGKTCAKKLSAWVEAVSERDYGSLDAQSTRRKSLADMSSGSELEQIMVIRDGTTGRVYPADIVGRLPDGRVVAVDLESAQRRNKRASGGALPVTGARVVLQSSGAQVISTFRDELKSRGR